MGYTPAALVELVSAFKHEQRALASEADGLERLCGGYIEPLLGLLGWDVTHAHDAEVGLVTVEALRIDNPGAAEPLRAYLLHEQAYHYQRHHLIGVGRPPIGRRAPTLLTALDPILSHSPVLIETLALTDFACLRFYDNTPSEPHHPRPRRSQLYSLPSWQYAAWWDSLSLPEVLLYSRRKFEIYAVKLRLWSGLPISGDIQNGR